LATVSAKVCGAAREGLLDVVNVTLGLFGAADGRATMLQRNWRSVAEAFFLRFRRFPRIGMRAGDKDNQ
jgi:hypothetical protein